MRTEVAVIGAGIVGTAVAAELSRAYKVLLLEAESQPGYHATSRSVSIFDRAYGNAVVRALTAASFRTLHTLSIRTDLPPVLSPRGVLYVARADQIAALNLLFERVHELAPDTVRQDGHYARQLVPVLRPGLIAACMHEPDAAEIDVATLHGSYLTRLRAHDGTLAVNARVEGLRRHQGKWHINAGGQDVTADVVVNAAGAWADEIACMAGGRPLGLVAKRRTVCTVPLGAPHDAGRWPFVVDVDEQFYFKQETGRLLVSPADATHVPPGDVHPDELDVATAVDRLESATILDVRRVMTKWAGLRSFLPDDSPAVGADASLPGFHWAAGLGGYGIQTAPAVAACTAAALSCSEWPADVSAAGLSPAALNPARFPAGACVRMSESSH